MKIGEIAELGRHRLMCGDATSVDDVMKLVDGDNVNLVLTDPPYGLKIQHKNGSIGGAGATAWMPSKKWRENIKYTKFQGDETTIPARKNYEIVKELSDKMIIWGGNYFTDFLPPHGGYIFWDKQRPSTITFGDGELAYNTCNKVVRKYTHKQNGCIMEGNRTLNPIPRLHPTQKPVELHMKILEDFTKPGDIILDCFGGSGTTLIACEMTGRKCLMMEISSEYCDVIKTRYEKLTEGNLPLEVENA